MSTKYKTVISTTGETLKIRLNLRLKKYTILYNSKVYKTFTLTKEALLKTYNFRFYHWIEFINSNNCYLIKTLKRQIKNSSP